MEKRVMSGKFRNTNLIILINLTYFQVGLLMSIISALIPEIIGSYKLSYALAATLPFSYYLAVTLFSVPAGIANEKFTPKSMLLFSFSMAIVGALFFAILPNYFASVASLFIIGGAVAIAQVSVVPLLRKACGPENLAFHSSLNMLLYGIGAFISPHAYSYLTTRLLDKAHEPNFIFGILLRIVPENLEWVSAYWLFVFILVTLILLTAIIRFPPKETGQSEKSEDKKAYLSLIKNKYIVLYFLALVAYCSCEQGIANWMSKFLQDYHGLNPQTTGSSILSWYWLLLSLGCIGGMILLKFFDSRRVLFVLTVLAMISLSIGLYGNVQISMYAFPLVGVFESIMWPIIITFALNSVTRHHGALTGIMYTASIGGALGPLLIGNLGDIFGLRISLSYLYIPFLFILSVPFWAKPLVTNKTISRKVLNKQSIT